MGGSERIMLQAGTCPGENEMQQHIGELIRQLRREQNITQSELGSDHYSKSYVSAVERNKILPSLEALRFFATQLNYPDDYFTSLFQDVSGQKQLPVQAHVDNVGPNAPLPQEGAISLLDVLLNSTDLQNLPMLQELPTLSPEVFAALQPDKQARYYYLMGQVAKKKKEGVSALRSFEHALTLASAEQQVAVLDELGLNYYMMRAYETALLYHRRALDIPQKAQSNGFSSDALFKLELHCGDDYRALGAYQQACLHYENARALLHPEHDMRTAGRLYQELGYCLYAAIYQQTVLSIPAEKRVPLEEMEREFQRAISFLLRSRTLYQVSGDMLGECRSRLIQVLALLNLSNHRKQYRLNRAASDGAAPFPYAPTALDEAEEQCRQILVKWQDPQEGFSSLTVEHEDNFYRAMAYLVRIYTQRAFLARLSGNIDIALYERSMAVHFCEQTLHALSEQHLPFDLLRDVLAPRTIRFRAPTPSQLHLPKVIERHETLLHTPVAYIEMCLAAGEIAEELGHAADDVPYAHYCYDHATRALEAALSVSSSLQTGQLDGLLEPDYNRWCYQRSVSLLEERNLVAPEYADETNKVLVKILAEAFHHTQYFPLLFK